MVKINFDGNFFLLILIGAAVLYCGWLLGNSRADDAVADAHRAVEERVKEFERIIDDSTDLIFRLREANRELEESFAGVERDRIKLERVNETYARRIDDLRRINTQLRDAILSAQSRVNGFTYNVEHLERILRDIESQQ